jgi:signal-transduction protein with cAMP-binding, CBS, and nucleotidyltransferase domain
MGLLGTAIAFAAGYVAGTKMGDKPVDAIRDAVGQARERASTLANQANDSGSRAIGGMKEQLTGSKVDVREVRDVMTAAPETIELDAPIRDAAALMARSDIGSVIVVEGGQNRGIVTDRDIALRVVAEGADPVTTMVAQVMTPFPASIAPTASVHEAIQLMRQHDIRRLPVVESGRPVGMVALADLSWSPEAQALLADISSAPPNN